MWQSILLQANCHNYAASNFISNPSMKSSSSLGWIEGEPLVQGRRAVWQSSFLWCLAGSWSRLFGGMRNFLLSTLLLAVAFSLQSAATPEVPNTAALSLARQL